MFNRYTQLLLFFLTTVFIFSCSTDHPGSGGNASGLNDLDTAQQAVQSHPEVTITLADTTFARGAHVAWGNISTKQQLELMAFWGNFQMKVGSADRLGIYTMIHFPLDGEWGYAIGLDQEGRQLSKADFEKGYAELFSPVVIKQLKQALPSSLELYTNPEGDFVESFRIGVDLTSDEDEFESSRIFEFCKNGKSFMLCRIWHAG